jgi:hypothetical protein
MPLYVLLIGRNTTAARQGDRAAEGVSIGERTGQHPHGPSEVIGDRADPESAGHSPALHLT